MQHLLLCFTFTPLIHADSMNLILTQGCLHLSICLLLVQLTENARPQGPRSACRGCYCTLFTMIWENNYQACNTFHFNFLRQNQILKYNTKAKVDANWIHQSNSGTTVLGQHKAADCSWVSPMIRYRLNSLIDLEERSCCPGCHWGARTHLQLPVIQELALGSSPSFPRADDLTQWERQQCWSPSLHPVLCSRLPNPRGRGIARARYPHGSIRTQCPGTCSCTAAKLVPESGELHFRAAVLLQQLWLHWFPTQP